MQVDHYTIDKSELIGRGSFGEVFKCKDNLNEDLNLCAKIITQGISDPKIKREFEIMENLIASCKINENIVGVYHVMMDSEKIVIILERCETDLRNVMDHQRIFPVDEALDIIRQIIHGYKALYKADIIHRDLKPANILKKGSTYKIADMGMARAINRAINQKLTKVGTPAYAAPQLFFAKNFTDSADVYSVGVIFYELLFGCLPITAKNQSELRQELRKLETQPIKIDTNKQGVTQEIAKLLQSMLEFSENNRISWKELFFHKLINPQESGKLSSDFYVSNGDHDDSPIRQISQNSDQKIEIQQQPAIIVPKPIIPQIRPAQSLPQQNSPGQQPLKPIIMPNPQIIIPQNIVQIQNAIKFTQSDQLYQIANNASILNDVLTKYLNVYTVNIPILISWFLYQGNLIQMSRSLLIHSKSQKSIQNSQQQQIYNLNQVENLLKIMDQNYQKLLEKVNQYQLGSQYNVNSEVSKEFQNYYNNFQAIYIQTLRKFNKIVDSSFYFTEYIKMVYLMEQMKEYSPSQLARSSELLNSDFQILSKDIQMRQKIKEKQSY